MHTVTDIAQLDLRIDAPVWAAETGLLADTPYRDITVIIGGDSAGTNAVAERAVQALADLGLAHSVLRVDARELTLDTFHEERFTDVIVIRDMPSGDRLTDEARFVLYALLSRIEEGSRTYLVITTPVAPDSLGEGLSEGTASRLTSAAVTIEL